MSGLTAAETLDIGATGTKTLDAYFRQVYLSLVVIF